MKLDIKPFSRDFLESEGAKALALKPLEEAAEVFGAWQENGAGASYDLVYEALDCMQACVNLLEFMGGFGGRGRKGVPQRRIKKRTERKVLTGKR